jgi:hypothetical protein
MEAEVSALMSAADEVIWNCAGLFTTTDELSKHTTLHLSHSDPKPQSSTSVPPAPVPTSQTPSSSTLPTTPFPPVLTPQSTLNSLNTLLLTPIWTVDSQT